MRTFTTVFALLFTLRLSAQEVTSTVSSSAGNTVEVDGISISYTVGEAMVSTQISPDLVLYQGFQQGIESMITSNDPTLIDVRVKVYPNPTANMLHVELSATENISWNIELLDLKGSQLQTHNTDKSGIHDFQLSLEDLPVGIYQLRMHDTEGHYFKSINIQKSY